MREYPRYGDLSLDVAGDGSLYVDRTFEIELEPGVFQLIFPGLRTDLASFPRVMHPFVKPWGPWGKPAVKHDQDYRHGIIARETADLWFLWGLETQGASKLERYAMYWTLRVFGGPAWRRPRRVAGVSD